jgi:hypothetical protein
MPKVKLRDVNDTNAIDRKLEKRGELNQPNRP